MGKWQGNCARLVARLALGIAGVLLTFAAYGQDSCGFAANNPYGTGALAVTLPLNVSALSVLRDLPNGRTIYRQRVRHRPIMLECGHSGAMRGQFSETPLPLSSWNSGAFAGRVYETGVPGIGIVVSMVWDRGGTTNSGSTSYFPFSRNLSGPDFTEMVGSIDVQFVKTGEVSPGIISGQNLPTIQLDAVQNNVAFTVARIGFSGNLQIVGGTCTTPNVTVPLGEHQTSAFRGRGTGTPWKGFDIELRNCPAFHGRTETFTTTDSEDGWALSSPYWVGNYFEYTLTPLTDRPAGLANVVLPSPTTSGPAAAGGVGIEIQTENSQPADFGQRHRSWVSLDAVNGKSYRIWAKARYIQLTDAAPTPGPANAPVLFTIHYQ